jgi:hypothetical protein
MCEVATHRVWAEDVLTRADIYGISEEAEEIVRSRPSPRTKQLQVAHLE